MIDPTALSLIKLIDDEIDQAEAIHHCQLIENITIVGKVIEQCSKS